MSAFLEHYGLILMFLTIALESSGLPVPGETSLIAAGVLASRGSFSITAVIVVASLAAIVGDNLGFVAGRHLLPRALRRFPRVERLVARTLPPTEALFERHGGKAVFLARFLPVVRFTGAWMAGLSGMKWPRFLAWNVLGGVAWATSFGLLAYLGGAAAADAVARFGVIGGAVVVVAAIVIAFVLRRIRRRIVARDLERPV